MPAAELEHRPRLDHEEVRVVVGREPKADVLLDCELLLLYVQQRPPSSVDPGVGTLIRYSFPTGLKTCWTRIRSADWSVESTLRGSLAETATERSYVVQLWPRPAAGVGYRSRINRPSPPPAQSGSAFGPTHHGLGHKSGPRAQIGRNRGNDRHLLDADRRKESSVSAQPCVSGAPEVISGWFAMQRLVVRVPSSASMRITPPRGAAH